MALVLPTVTLTLAGRAHAQVTQLPSWAVTEFKDLKGNASLKYGQAAADAVITELGKTNRYDVVPAESVKRSIEALQLTSPPEGMVNLQRIGDDVKATTIVQGEVLDYQVRAVGGGKQAIVALRMVAYQVASGLPVNGALERGESTIRGGSVTNDALVNDAISQAAAVAVRTMQGQQLPSATVLNTGSRTALLNQGTRSGFKTGDTVILTRGPLQVGTARIGVIEPDQAEITIERSVLGVAPGDRAQAVFTPPALPASAVSIFKNDGGLRVSNHPKRNSNNATLISALLVVGLVAVLLSSGNSSSTSAASATAEAVLDSDGISPAVRVSWKKNGFYKGSGSSGAGVDLWQIYRSDVSLNPVIVVNEGSFSTDFQGTASNAVTDSSRQNNSSSTGYFTSPNPGGTSCISNSPTNATFPQATTPLLAAGRPYVYQVEAVYHVPSTDVANATAGTTGGGTTGGGTTGGGTTGTTGTTGGTTGTSTTGTTATTGTSGSTATGGGTGTTGGTSISCYFRSGRTATGVATPLSRPTPISPPNSVADLTIVSFNFNSVATGNGAITPQYVIEFSDEPTFNSRYTVRSAPSTTTTIRLATGTKNDLFNGKTGSTGAKLSVASPIYYRVGVRNTQDRPGPVKDRSNGQRYIYSAYASFTRSTLPPPQPVP